MIMRVRFSTRHTVAFLCLFFIRLCQRPGKPSVWRDICLFSRRGKAQFLMTFRQDVPRRSVPRGPATRNSVIGNTAIDSIYLSVWYINHIVCLVLCRPLAILLSTASTSSGDWHAACPRRSTPLCAASLWSWPIDKIYKIWDFYYIFVHFILSEPCAVEHCPTRLTKSPVTFARKDEFLHAKNSS